MAILVTDDIIFKARNITRDRKKSCGAKRLGNYIFSKKYKSVNQILTELKGKIEKCTVVVGD